MGAKYSCVSSGTGHANLVRAKFLGAAGGADGCEIGELILPKQKFVVGAVAGGFGGCGIADDACGFHFFGSLLAATVDIFVGHWSCSVTRGRDWDLGEGLGPLCLGVN